MRFLWKKVVCSILIVCTLSSVVALGATESAPSLSDENNSDTIQTRANYLAVDSSISGRNISWYQGSNEIAYRIWVDNTTGALMTVTITSPSGHTKNLYITSGSNQTYTNNDAEHGVYTLSFHTYASSFSGTVRVRVSTTLL